MLVLSRKEGESIIINENITIVVARIQGGKVRIGIEAPKDVPVRRQELHPEQAWNTRPETVPTDLVTL